MRHERQPEPEECFITLIKENGLVVEKEITVKGFMLTQKQLEFICNSQRSKRTVSARSGVTQKQNAGLLKRKMELQEGTDADPTGIPQKQKITAQYHACLDEFLVNNESTRKLKKYQRFTLWERMFIQKHLSKEFYLSGKAIARKLNCSADYFHREVNQGSEGGIYNAETAEKKANVHIEKEKLQREIALTQRSEAIQATDIVLKADFTKRITASETSRNVLLKEEDTLIERTVVTNGFTLTDKQVQIICDCLQEKMTPQEVCKKSGILDSHYRYFIQRNKWLHEGVYLSSKALEGSKICSLYSPHLDDFLSKNVSKKLPGKPITLWERKLLQKHLSEDFYLSNCAIARKLNCSESSIRKEVKQGSVSGIYDADIADQKAKRLKPDFLSRYHPSLDEFLTNNQSARNNEKTPPFTIWERKFIQKHFSEEFYLSGKEIGRKLNCSDFSVRKEVKQGSENGIYDADIADQKAKTHRQRMVEQRSAKKKKNSE